MPEHDLKLVKSGTPQQNADLLLHILRQDEEEFQIGDINHPIVDYILMNTAALAVVSGSASTWVEGVKLAKDAIVSGKSLEALEDFKRAIPV